MTNKRWLLCEWWISTKAWNIWNISRVILEVMEMRHEEKDTTYEVRTPQYSETPKCLICCATKFAIFIQSIDSIFIRILPRTLAIPNFCPSSGLGLKKFFFHSNRHEEFEFYPNPNRGWLGLALGLPVNIPGSYGTTWNKVTTSRSSHARVLALNRRHISSRLIPMKCSLLKIYVSYIITKILFGLYIYLQSNYCARIHSMCGNLKCHCGHHMELRPIQLVIMVGL